MTTPNDIDILRSDDLLVASITADAMSEARGALQFTYPSHEVQKERSEELFELCDLFHNVAVWLVLPESRPHGATSALDEVLMCARHRVTREWVRSELVRRNREDVALRLDELHP